MSDTQPESRSAVDEVLALGLDDTRTIAELAYKRGLEEGLNATRFELNHESLGKLQAWRKAQNDKVAAGQGNPPGRPNYGVSGGAWSYIWTPTSLGVVTKVRNEVTGDVLDLTDYSSW